VAPHLSDVRSNGGRSAYLLTIDLKQLEPRLAARGMNELSNSLAGVGVDVGPPQEADYLWSTDLTLGEDNAGKRHLKRR
jgi:hypothetical protein